MNLKGGRGTGPQEKWGTDPARSTGKNFLIVPLHFLALKHN